MNNQKHIQRQVEETMVLLEHPEPIKAGPWFRSHVYNRLQTMQESPHQRGTWRALLLRPGLLMVVVVLNFATLFVTLTHSTTAQDTREAYLSSVASEYQLSVSSELFETYSTFTEQ